MSQVIRYGGFCFFLLQNLCCDKGDKGRKKLISIPIIGMRKSILCRLYKCATSKHEYDATLMHRIRGVPQFLGNTFQKDDAPYRCCGDNLGYMVQGGHFQTSKG